MVLLTTLAGSSPLSPASLVLALMVLIAASALVGALRAPAPPRFQPIYARPRRAEARRHDDRLRQDR